MTLTKVDLKQIDIRLGNLKGDLLEEVDNKLQNLKSEFFGKVDPILKEVTTAREERPLIENRIEASEDIHPEGKHGLFEAFLSVGCSTWLSISV